MPKVQAIKGYRFFLVAKSIADPLKFKQVALVQGIDYGVNREFEELTSADSGDAVQVLPSQRKWNLSLNTLFNVDPTREFNSTWIENEASSTTPRTFYLMYLKVPLTDQTGMNIDIDFKTAADLTTAGLGTYKKFDAYVESVGLKGLASQDTVKVDVTLRIDGAVSSGLTAALV